MNERVEVDVQIHDVSSNISYIATEEDGCASKHWSAGTLARVVIDLAIALASSNEKHFLSPRRKGNTDEEEKVYLAIEKIIELHNKRFEI